MDLMEMIKGAINNQATGQIGTALGTDAQTASKAIGIALPAILGGLVKQASAPTGASNLFAALNNVDPGLLDNLGSALSGAKLQSVIEMGTKMLPLIFGSNYSSIFATLGKLTGLGSGKIGPLLGVLAPIVMGVLAKAKKTSGLDLAGFSKMLMDQKKNLVGLDSGLADQLGIGNLTGAGKQVLESTGRSLPKVVESTRPVMTSGGGSLGRWLIPLLGLLAVGLAYYVYVYSRDRGEVTTPKNSGAAPAAPATMTPGMRPPAKTAETPKESPTESTTKKVTDFIKDVSKTFTEIKDEASAKKAAETLQKLAGKIDSLGLDKLTGPTKAVVGTAVKKFVEEFKAWAEKEYAKSGVKEALEPAVNAIVDKLKGIGD